MNAAVLGGLVEQWLWRCQMIATQYQLRQAVDLAGEIDKLVAQAEAQARQMQASGALLLSRIERRLGITAHIAELAEPPPAAAPEQAVLNLPSRARALHALADAFGRAAQRLQG
jgi:hypothetical protein